MATYWDSVHSTYIEAWPAELLRLSFATKLIALTVEERDALCLLCEALQYADSTDASTFEQLRDSSTLGRLSQRLHAAMQEFPMGVFARLGSRSPKDSWAAHDARFCYRSGSNVLTWFAESERIHDDLSLAMHVDYEPYIALREWKQIDPQDEFRVFVKGRRIVGVSQYDHFHHYPALQGAVGSVRWAIDTFWPALRAALHIDSVIVDLWVRPRLRPGSNETEYSVKMVEVNPYFTMTDPCLFDWCAEPEWSAVEPYEFRVKS